MLPDQVIESLIEGAINKGTSLSDHVNIQVPSFHRDHYVGMSSITSCPRALWFNYHKISEYIGLAVPKSEPHSPKLTRIFRTGHVIEREIIHWLTVGGIEVTDTQTAYSEFNNQFRGHCDGIIRIPNITPIVFDVKTMSDKSFTKFCSSTIKSYNYGYYVQLTMYMYYSNFKERAVIIAYNKNNSDVKVKVMPYEDTVAKTMRLRAANVIMSKSLDTVIVNREWYNCSECKFRQICDKYDGK